MTLAFDFTSFSNALDEAEKCVLEYAKVTMNNNLSHMADALGINRITLRKKLQHHGIYEATRPRRYRK